MTISVAGFVPTPSAERSSTREARTEHDRAPEQFAGMLAASVHASVPKPEPEKPRDGTSELDRADESDTEEKKKIKHAKARTNSASHGLAQTNAATAGDTVDVVQSTSALDPELQDKLARVMSRMRDETGHDVQVAETFRTQERQDVLFAQGRETPGQIVTWTRSSKHTLGRAVDLVVDGGTAGLDAYATLQRIAKEEGLRTLGARDPGHLELPGTGTGAPVIAANDVTSLIPVEPADASGPGQVSIARLAQVAQVAQVAYVETPAQIARVATTGRAQTPGASKSALASATTSVQNATAGADDAQSASQRSADDSASGDQGTGSGGNTKGDHRGGYSALAAAVAHRTDASYQSVVPGVSTDASMTAAERVAKLIAAREDAPARPLSQITMSVDAGNGTSDRVQVGLRGSSLNATIDAADAHGAQVMNSRADELVRALSRDGVEVESLRVRAAAGTAAATPSQASHTSADSRGQSRFERNNPWQQHERQRSQEDRRHQQRNQRGGQER